MHHRKLAALMVVSAVGLAACSDDTVSPDPQMTPEASWSQLVAGPSGLTAVGESIDDINAALAARGANYAVARAEYVLAANASGPLVDRADHTIFANNRQLRLPSRWVPGDERRAADGNNITFLNFQPLMGANAGSLDSEPAVDASFATWDAQQCTTLDLVKRVDNSVFPSAIIGFTGLPNAPFAADIATIGFLPGAFFELLEEGASENVLGVTFTLVWGTNTPDGFVPSDVDNDGRNDTALKEVWYNDNFNWSTEGGGVDIETVALHENGHALELGHFGMIHATFNNGRGNDRLGTLHVSPRAVMNAIILGTLRSPLGTDNSSYCSNFEGWPE